MTTIAELHRLAADLNTRVNNEAQANENDFAALVNHVTEIRESMRAASNALEMMANAIEAMFADRRDALAATIGAVDTPHANGSQPTQGRIGHP